MSDDGWRKICQECTGYYDEQCHYCDGKNHFRPYRWVSVKDRLPEGKGAYLIYHNNSAANIAIYSGSDYWSYGYYSNRIYPTHWMPLPAAPEDK